MDRKLRADDGAGGEPPQGATALTDAEEYAAAVLGLVRRIPPARAMTYGLIAEIVAEDLGRGGPRQVGNVMAGSGDRYQHLVPEDAVVVGPAQDSFDVPWWRVVNAAGSPPAQHLTAALDALRAEGCPLTRDGRRVDLKRAVWFPDGPDPAR
ncbi:MGMT family protein [Myceligenerans indicum]|uniref:MGMT family protein n=1 Tax=Myceligenerans indicum TaxID=2593663 RepID=UPI00355700B3